MILKTTILLAAITPFTNKACDEGKRSESPRSPIFHEKVRLSTLVQQALDRTRNIQKERPNQAERLEGEIKTLKKHWEDGFFRGVHSKLPKDMQGRTTNCEEDYGTTINWDRSNS
jgi:hypothetical protein